MTANRTFPVAACLIALASLPAKGEETLDEALSNCAAIASDEDRLSCFDALARDAGSPPGKESRPAGEPPRGAAAAASPDTPEAGTSVRPLGDDVGLPKEDDDEDERAVYVATLAGCEVEGPSQRTFFLLDNGQVWRQSDSENLHLRDCGGRVEITRDFFGYKLYMADEDRTIRVRRVR